MSKIICDVCGTSFPDTTEQCPICGCVRSADAKVMPGDPRDSEQNTNGTYSHVKGGRFSKANVKKRNAPKQDQPEHGSNQNESDKGNKGLVIVAVVLLLSIIAVSVYFVIRFGDMFAITKKGSEETTTAPVVDVKPENNDDDQQDDPIDESVPCNRLYVLTTEIAFDEAGLTKTISVITEPVDTTDAISFEVADPTVATVDENGVVTAVAEGETVITVKCGDLTGECVVICAFKEEEEIPDEPVDVFSAESKGNALVDNKELKLNTYMQLRDFTVPANGFHEFSLRNADGEELDFEIVENSAYCSVDGKKITSSADAPAGGSVMIYIVYGENAGDYIECTLRF